MAIPGALSVVLPARNEQENIAAALESLAAQPEVAEIVVVDDHSSDGTAIILDDLRRAIPQLRVVRNGELPPGWTGKCHALACGVGETSGGWLLFTDADVRHRPGSAARALAIAAETGAALVSFSPAQQMETWWERAVIPSVYCALAERFSYDAVSDPSHPAAAANGQYLLIRRDVYEAVGGHAAIRGEILEDVALARRAKQAGYRLNFARGENIAQTRMYRRFGEMWRGWTKNLFGLLGSSYGAVAAAVAKILLADFLPSAVVLAALVEFRRGSAGWLWAGVVAIAVLIARHAVYARALQRNRFPLSCISYYVVGSLLFACLLMASAVQHARGEVEWKGRKYAV